MLCSDLDIGGGCSSTRLNLLIKSGPGVILVRNESQEFNLVFADLRGMMPRLTADIYDNRVSWNFPPSDAPVMKERLLEILLQLKYSSPLSDFRMGGQAFDQRTTCNAIETIHYLTARYNSRTPDQIVIVANLCHYPVRLDTNKIGVRFLQIKHLHFRAGVVEWRYISACGC
jgi:hypothetical protein